MMASLEQTDQKVVFGLDIGTRSVVGTVGYMNDGQFNVIAQAVEKHQTRAMLDGQIHDIGKVGATIRVVKEKLEQQTDIHLTDVCIAAAGRVLRTVRTNYEYEYPESHDITDEDIYNLDSAAVQQAYSEFLQKNTSDLKFYLVGYSVMHYYLDGYQIANLEGHNAGKVSVELIATFLPDDCVDGLYKACERAGLNVANLTLEPIAAMMVAIPDRFRMLNLALVDVGAGTSDICVTNDGSITAYGMLPIAGDDITEIIAQHCLVDFNQADEIKIAASHNDRVDFIDIMGLRKTITAKDIAKIIRPQVDMMAKKAAEEIKRLNGDKPVSAVFVVGGGGCVPGYTKAIAREMDIPEERVALRGEEVMKSITFLNNDGIERDSLLVTPLGICISYYEEANNIIFVSFNGEQTRIYDNGKLQIIDAAMQASFQNEDLFPKRGKELRYLVNGKERVARGEPGEAAVITLNGKAADIHSKIRANDIIDVTPSTAGEPGKAVIENIPEFKTKFVVNVNGVNVEASRFATVNGEPQTALYNIKNGDDIQILDYNTVEQVAALMDIEITEDTYIIVNNEHGDKTTPVYENFKVEFKDREEAIMEYYRDFPDADEVAVSMANEEAYESDDYDVRKFDGQSDQLGYDDLPDDDGEYRRSEDSVKNILARDIHILVNNEAVTLHGKSEYVFVDIFDSIDFDLTRPNGRAIVTTLNGKTPDYLQSIHEGDKIEVYWK
ncbi:cell division protein FtsA [Butyrivibrio hungatei]|jgi:cell division protein FtsA|uniref:Cell division protein FtsA n=1 Tax=Butyrivibrio hungatei TaxID=185008 RepID=A0A1G5EM78_9FIRM|nr:cell division FtsA domain-containing protein [Butyrivibrio hungatei]MEE3469559.1 cell division FtsA domain-containing protein [Butyrivibrio hungatei]SCY28107.1 cell division protein FtsA [Butyrivibrio hungatei]